MSIKSAALFAEASDLGPQISKSVSTYNVESLSQSPRTPIDEPNFHINQDSLESVNARFHGLWDERMKDKGGNGWPHEKTAVLLISWHDTLDELKVEDEVHRLHTTFQFLFDYKVTRRYIMPNKLAQVQLNQYLAEFVFDNDDQETLLVIYYAGHGIGVKPGRLVLTANTQQEVQDRNSIMWHQVENNIKTTLADVFVIFDCCFAGNLARGGRGQSSRNFEFMGACNWSSITRIPGEDSFTSALIWALEEFAAAGIPFTTTQLQNKIGQEAPHFPRDQFPVLVPRGDGQDCARRLRLGIKRKHGAPEMELGHNTSVESVEIKDIVDLRVCFPQHPDDDDIEALSGALKELIETKQLKAQGVQWLGLRENPTPEYLAHENLIHHVAFKWRRTVQNRRASSVHAVPVLRISTITTGVEEPPPTPSPSSSGDPEHLAPEHFDLGNRPRTTTPSFVIENSSEERSISKDFALMDLIP